MCLSCGITLIWWVIVKKFTMVVDFVLCGNLLLVYFYTLYDNVENSKRI